MQFTVTINQVKALEWSLNLPQANLFAFVYECPSWCRPYQKDGEIYYILSKQKIASELPLLGSPDTIYRNLRELANKGVIELTSTNKYTLVRLTEKGKEWNKKIVPTPTPEDTGSEKYPTKNNLGRKNIRSGSENSPNNQYTNQVTPTHSDARDEIFTRPDPQEEAHNENVTTSTGNKFSMHRDWRPAEKEMSFELIRRGLPTDTIECYDKAWLQDFTSYFADKPSVQKSEAGWTSRFAQWIQQNLKQPQRSTPSQTGDRSHEKRQQSTRKRLSAAEARARDQAERSGESGTIIQGKSIGPQARG